MTGKDLIFVSALSLTIWLCLLFGIPSAGAARAGSPASSPSISGAANLKGTVRFEGTVPKPKLISMSADPSCAKQHPSPVLAQEVLTDSKGDLQDVIVFIADGLGD